MRAELLFAVPLALAGCMQSEDDKIVAETAASVTSCADYAHTRVQANCVRFVEHARNPDSAFGRNSGALVRALQVRWQTECAAQKGAISRAEIMTTLAISRTGAHKGQQNSTELCAAEAGRQLRALPEAIGPTAPAQ